MFTEEASMAKAYTLEQAKERAFDYCNLEGDDCDIYNVLYRYKAIRDLPPEKVDDIYNEIAESLGFCL